MNTGAFAVTNPSIPAGGLSSRSIEHRMNKELQRMNRTKGREDGQRMTEDDRG